MKILITGAGGFVGGYLCKRLSQHHEVIGITRTNCGKLTKNTQTNVIWRQADLAEGLSIPDDVDVIVHAAARTPGPEVTISDYVASNIIATRNMIDFALQNKVKIFIYFSAISVYGRIESTIVAEETSIREPGPYGITKYLGELLLREKEDVLPSVVFRLPVVVGAGMKSGWLFETYQTLQRGEALHIYNGDSPYNMVAIADVYELVSNTLERSPSGSSLFTISCHDFLSIREIVELMKRYIHSESEIVEGVSDEKGFTISMEKARRLLGFQPKSASEILTGFLEEIVADERGEE